MSFFRVCSCAGILLLLSGMAQLHAQDSSAVTGYKRTFKPAFDFDQRFTFITKETVNIWGGRAGVIINDKFKVGMGAYWSKDQLRTIDADPSDYQHHHFAFGTVYYEPFLFRLKYAEMSVPFELGYGKSTFLVYASEDNRLISKTEKNMIPSGAALSLSFKLPPIGRFKPTRWVGINFLGGYRYCLFENQFNTDYNGLFWSISGAIFLDRVSDDYHYWRKSRAGKEN